MDKYNSTSRVQLPGWEDEHPFNALLRRPSLLTMAAEGSIPNELIGAAQRLFCEGYDQSLPLDQLGRLLRRIAAEALVEPTLEELEAEGCRLTDLQLAAIYNFSQAGYAHSSPFVSGTALLSLLAMCKRYNERPSRIVGEREPYAAYCLDEACMYILCRIEEEGRLPRSLERLSEPSGNGGSLRGLINRKGVECHDYRRNGLGLS